MPVTLELIDHARKAIVGFLIFAFEVLVEPVVVVAHVLAEELLELQ